VKKYSKLEMEVIALNNEDVLTASGGSFTPEDDVNGYCSQYITNFGGVTIFKKDWFGCMNSCYSRFNNDPAKCEWYRNGKN
jgi:hypothetical protein